MQTNQAGLDLIKAFEGFRAKAYLCPAGVWTVGYGHTSAAGLPVVRRGKTVSRAEAARILSRDLAAFEGDVARAVRVPLTGNQFSALVSFAYNVGPAAFRTSSVLKAVNAGKLDQVPRRLALWTRAGGRVLPGLVRRRSEEGALFMRAEGAGLMAAQLARLPARDWEEMEETRGMIDPPSGTPLSRSTTVWASLANGAAGIAASVSGAVYWMRDVTSELYLEPAFYGWLLAAAVIAGLAIYIVRERKLKAEDDGV